jgi:nucleotide-binding universal stress UspA family protein
MNFLRNIFGKDEKDESSPPSAETLEEAKKIFIKYSCNGLYMAQNDVHFSQYHISKEQEGEWRNEFITYWRSQLSTEDLTAIQKLRDAQAVESIPDLLAMVDQGDSYAQLRVAEALAAIGYMSKDKSLRKQTQATAIKIAQSLLDHPVQVSERHKIEIERLGGSDPEEYIILFAKNVVK